MIASSGMSRENVAMVVPSFGAELARKLMARSDPAPGMFCTITVGWPGMCRPR